MRVAASRSHRNERTEALLDRIAEATGTAGEPVALGSSLKFCRLAEGGMDVYPRFGPTSEWDTAAGQAIVEAGSEEHTSELQSLMRISYAVFCLKKKTIKY